MHASREVRDLTSPECATSSSGSTSMARTRSSGRLVAMCSCAALRPLIRPGQHEWSTHGTCYSTLETKCLPSGSPKGAEVRDTHVRCAPHRRLTLLGTAGGRLLPAGREAVQGMCQPL